MILIYELETLWFLNKNYALKEADFFYQFLFYYDSAVINLSNIQRKNTMTELGFPGRRDLEFRGKWQ